MMTSTSPRSTDWDEFITIIGSDMTEIANEFRAQGLAEQDYAIVHRAGRHRFTRVIGEKGEAMFGGTPLIAATFRRRAA
jgi:hypothetical protein